MDRNLKDFELKLTGILRHCNYLKLTDIDIQIRDGYVKIDKLIEIINQFPEFQKYGNIKSIMNIVDNDKHPNKGYRFELNTINNELYIRAKYGYNETNYSNLYKSMKADVYNRPIDSSWKPDNTQVPSEILSNASNVMSKPISNDWSRTSSTYSGTTEFVQFPKTLVKGNLHNDIKGYPKGNGSLNDISHSIINILRHKLHLNMHLLDHNVSAGYVSVDKILGQYDGVSIDDIKYICRTDNKNRFGLTIINEKLYIRANQGHNTETAKLIDPYLLLIEINEPLKNCIHGTYLVNLDSIHSYGLNRMNRSHVHFASSLDGRTGYRQTAEVFIHIDMERALKDGIKFYMSTNGVILSEGPILSKYFKHIKDIQGIDIR